MEGPVVIAGVTGTIGSRLARLLAKDGVPVRGVVRHVDATPVGEGIDVVAADLQDPVEARRALKGAKQVYLTPPLQGADPLLSERNVVRAVCGAAADVGVEHLVMHSALHTDRDGTGVRLLDNKRTLEQVVGESGVPWSILRPGLFLETLLEGGPHTTTGLTLPMATGHRFGAIHAGDVAQAAKGLLEAGPQGEAFDLHIPGGVSAQDICQAAEGVLGRALDHHRPSPQDYRGMLPMGPAEADLYTELLSYVGASEYVGDPFAIQRVLPGFRLTDVKQALRLVWPQERLVDVPGQRHADKLRQDARR